MVELLLVQMVASLFVVVGGVSPSTADFVGTFEECLRVALEASAHEIFEGATFVVIGGERRATVVCEGGRVLLREEVTAIVPPPPPPPPPDGEEELRGDADFHKWLDERDAEARAQQDAGVCDAA